MVSVGAAAAHRYQGLEAELSGNVHRVRRRQVPHGRRVSHTLLFFDISEMILFLLHYSSSNCGLMRPFVGCRRRGGRAVL